MPLAPLIIQLNRDTRILFHSGVSAEVLITSTGVESGPALSGITALALTMNSSGIGSGTTLGIEATTIETVISGEIEVIN